MRHHSDHYLNGLPKFASLLPAILCKTNKDYDKQQILPGGRYWVEDVCLNPGTMQAFNQLTKWPHKDIVHPGFLHTLSFPLQLKLMLQKDFPFSIMGVVHIANSILQYRAVHPFDRVDMSCKLGEIRQLKIGCLFSIETEFFVKQHLVLQAKHQYLRRENVTKRKSSAVPEVDWEGTTDQQYWPLPNNLGWQYARCSQDYNPIHLHPLSAKFLGFKQHIAHGMWMKSRAFSALSEDSESAFKGPLSCNVEFKKPLFLPNSVLFQRRSTQQDAILEFRITSQIEQQHTPHLSGKLQFLDT